jgi:hypothetical protein
MTNSMEHIPSRIKVINSQLAKKLPTLNEPGGSLLYTRLTLDPILGQLKPSPNTHFLRTIILILSSNLHLNFPES